MLFYFLWKDSFFFLIKINPFILSIQADPNNTVPPGDRSKCPNDNCSHYYPHVPQLSFFFFSPDNVQVFVSLFVFVFFFNFHYVQTNDYNWIVTVLWNYVTMPPRPPRIHQLLRNHFNLGRWSSSGSDRSIAHFFTAQEIQSRDWEEKNKEQTRAWVNSSARRLSCDTAFPVD